MMLRTRLGTCAVLLVLGFLFLGLSHIPWVMELGMAVLCAMGLWELGRSTGLGTRFCVALAAAGSGLLLAMSGLSSVWIVGTVGLLLPAVMLVCWNLMGTLPERKGMKKWEFLVLCLEIPAFLSAAVHLRRRELGLAELTLAVMVCAVTDSVAYLLGRQFGRHKMAPVISPKKTVEGAVGGTLAAVVLLSAACAGAEALGLFGVRWGLLGVYLVTASVVGQYGDLCLSAVKRAVGIKDFGKLLPGHGGVLDRLDSHLLVIPYTFLYFSCFGSVFV